MKGLEITKELSDFATGEDYSQVIQVVTIRLLIYLIIRYKEINYSIVRYP